MAFNQRAAATITGAALGAYTSDITDNPVTGLVSTGIGAAMGSLMILPKTDIMSKKDVVTGAKLDIDSIHNRASVGISKNNEEFVAKFHQRADEILNLNNKVSKGVNVTAEETALLDNYKRNLNHIQTMLESSIGQMESFTQNPVKFIETLKRTDDVKLLKSIAPLMTNDELNLANMHGVTAPVTKDFEREIPDTMSKKDKVAKLSNIFQKQMGNSPEEAMKKAQMLVERSVGHISVRNGNVILQDKVDGARTVSVPITSYDKNGIRYHNAGDGKASSVKGFTPYMLLVADDESVKIKGNLYKPTVNDIKQGMAPEMMLQFLDEKTPLSSMMKDIKSHFSYNANEVSHEFFTGSDFEAKSPTFINNSNTVTTDRIMNVDLSGSMNTDRPLRNIKQMSTQSGITSEAMRVRREIPRLFPGEARGTFLGISGNSGTDLQTGTLKSISIFQPAERNSGGATLRDTVPYQTTRRTNALQAVYNPDGKNILYPSAQVLEKLDIKDELKFNQLSSALLGDNSKVLADGFGLYNKGDEALFANKSMKDVVIPRSTNTIIKDKVLFEAIESGDINQYIQDHGPIQVGNGTLAYDKNGRSIDIGKQHSSGSIVNAFIKDGANELVLRTETVFNPGKENLVKIYSQGSKALASGVDQGKFQLLTTLGSLMNQDKIDFKNGKIFLGSRQDKALAQYIPQEGLNMQKAAELLYNDKFMQGYGVGGVSLITSADRTGMKTLNSMLNGKDMDLLRDTYALKMIKDGKDARTAAITGFLTLETKASEDVLSHITSNLLDPLQRLRDKQATAVDKSKLHRYFQSGLLKTKLNEKSSEEEISKAMQRVSNAFRNASRSSEFIGDTKYAAMERLYKYVELSGVKADLSKGVSTFVGSTNKGSAMVGAGNDARMSWNAFDNMRSAGYSKEQLKWYGDVNETLKYEVQSLFDEVKRRGSNVSFNESIKGSEGVAESILANTTPEERLAKFKNTFSNFDIKDNPYLTYNLKYDKADIKSLNFSLISSARSGKFEIGDEIMTKELDKQRLNIMSLDIELSSANNAKDKKRVEADLMHAIDKYQEYARGMFSGDNNILKNTLSLYTENSSIRMAQPIGGDALKYIENIERNADGSYKAIANNVFLSSDGVASLSEQMDIPKHKIVYENIQGTTLRKAGYMDLGKFVPLSMLVTREPAVGILSSQYMEVIEDTSIKGGANSLFFAQGQYGYSIGMNGDFDQDTLQTLSKKLTLSQSRAMNAQSKSIRDAHQPHLNVEGEMSPKNGSKKIKSILEFDSVEQFDEYQVAGNAKGKMRKVGSPTATMLANNFRQAIDLEFGDDLSQRTLAKLGTYRLVENLLKSSHIDTEKFINGTQPIEELALAREEFLNGGSSEKYSKTLKSYLPQLLGQDLTEYTDPVKEANRVRLNESILKTSEIIEKAELSRARELQRLSRTPMDINKIGSLKDLYESATETMGHLDMFDVNRGTDLKRSSRQLYQGLNDAIVDGIKTNKGLLGLGVAALVGVNLLGRSEPSFTDSRANMRQHSTKMLQSPTNIEDIQTGIETNPTRASYVQPNTYSKSVDVSGSFTKDSYNNYSSLSSMLDPSMDSQIHDLNSAIFGGGLRSARLDITDL